MLVPVIMSGGAGTRLWPVSRKAHPKPFMRLADGLSLAEHTVRRAMLAATGKDVLTITSRDYYFLTRDTYLGVDQDAEQYDFLLEPCARNTAPAIAMAALRVQDRYGPDAQILVMPADHLVRNTDTFVAAVKQAEVLAAQGQLVTFGVYPTEPETGYGYIRLGEPLLSGFNVDAFVEKPDLETAQKYLETGQYRWNAGIFCFRCDTILSALQRYQPDLHRQAHALWKNLDKSGNPIELPQAEFADLPSISIDYAVMEQADNVAVVEGDFGWSDIGSWKAISELYSQDESGNRIRGQAVLVDSHDCFVQSEDRLVAAVGVHDLVIVDTGDAVLIADRKRAQEVKQVVHHLTQADHEAATFHRTVHRPWGNYTVLEDAQDCKVKRLVVKPGQVLSLQLHHQRSEHWTVIRGIAKVRVGDEESILKRNESTWIPVETLHRLENPGNEDLHLIEVQTGDYFGEDDIERFEDVYGRT